MENPAVLAALNPSESMSRAWRSHLLLLGGLLALIVVGFYPAISAALAVWIVSPTYSHCFLILPIVAWLIWEKRDVLRALQPTAEPRALIFLFPLLVMWWLGQLSAVNEVTQFAIVGMMQVAIVAMLGLRIARQIWFPIFFLLFLVPTGEYLTGTLQRFSTRFVDVGLNIFGIPHFTEGTLIDLTNGRFEIAEACAGLRFLIATVTLSVLFAYLSYRRVYKIVLFLLASVVIPIVGNGLRCLGIILLAHFTSNEYGAGADHVIYGWGFNLAILLAVILVGSMFRDPPEGALPVKARAQTVAGGGAPVLVVALMAAFLISAGPAWAWWQSGDSGSLNRNGLETVLKSGGWRQSAAEDNWRPSFSGANLQLKAQRGDFAPVDFFLAYYARPTGGHTVTARPNKLWNDKDWTVSGSAQVQTRLGATPIVLNEVTITSNSGGRRLVWYTYWSGGSLTGNPLLVRLFTVRGALSGGGGQAVIAVSSPLNDSVQAVRDRLGASFSPLGPVLQELPAVER